ncbi:MAG TPA: class I SAM-dependent methyltransferase [Pyrinomonadaceae bacterium]|nr:class I SAM-dependent methyltransferase [Pyrinomonadaceae bacterium]
MYSILDYGQMIADRIRTTAYLEALQLTVTSETVVLDLGTGVGGMAILACRAGARRVFAVEPDDSIQLAIAIAAKSGLEDRIQFIQAESTQVSLPEQVDVIVSDLRGVLPLYKTHIPSIIDARQRLLSPSGTLIPQQDTLWAAVVDSPELYRRYEEPWQHNDFDLDLQAGEMLAKNTWRKGRVNPDSLLAAPVCWATLDYHTISSPNVSFEGPLTVTRAGTGYGLNIWFDTTLTDGVSFSNAPDAPELIYQSAFFPWPKPLVLEIGDVINLHIRAELVGDDYVWCWQAHVIGKSPDHVKANFKQSTFLGVPFSPTNLKKQASCYVPTLNEEGRVNALILQLMDGQISLEMIAKRLQEHFPAKYADWKEALTDASAVSLKYSQ